jgi:hypothetical protein
VYCHLWNTHIVPPCTTPRTFNGVLNEEQVEIHTTTPEDSYFVSNVTRSSRLPIIQGNLGNEKFTDITSFLGSVEDIHLTKGHSAFCS